MHETAAAVDMLLTGRDQLCSMYLVHLEQDVAKIFSARFPVIFCHAPITYEGCKHLAQIIACYNDRHSLDGVTFSPLLIYTDSVGIITDVHEGANHHLVIDCDLHITYRGFADADLHTEGLRMPMSQPGLTTTRPRIPRCLL